MSLALTVYCNIWTGPHSVATEVFNKEEERRQILGLKADRGQASRSELHLLGQVQNVASAEITGYRLSFSVGSVRGDSTQ